LIKDYRIANSQALVTASFGRNRYPPWGLAGGQDGTPNQAEVRRTDGFIERRGRFSSEVLREGDVIRFITGTGGGYGDPKARDPQAVLDDVLDGFVSIDAARDIYGVAIAGTPLRIDEGETASLRSSVH